MPLPRSFRRPSILARRKEEGRKEGPVSKRGSILSLRKRRTWRKMGRKKGGVRRYMDGWMDGWIEMYLVQARFHMDSTHIPI